MLTAAGGGLAAGLGEPVGAWAGYGTVSVAALVGCGTLWQQRGLLERRAKEMARRRRADLDASATAELRNRAEIERLRVDLEHEQQYSALVQGQLGRAREQLERERAARRAAERELDALTGADGWQAAAPSVVLTVEEPVGGEAMTEKAAADKSATDEAAIDETVSTVPPATARPVVEPVRPFAGMSAARRRGWQVVDGEAGDEDADGAVTAETDRLYRPFIDQLSVTAVPVSDAALAMAPVIGSVDLDGILDLTAYDETVEFSVRELKGMA